MSSKQVHHKSLLPPIRPENIFSPSLAYSADETARKNSYNCLLTKHPIRDIIGMLQSL